MIDLNVRALAELTHIYWPGMITSKRGGVLNVTSTAAFQPGPLMAIYYASKAFVLSFSEGLAEELRGTGVTVTALCPGPVATEFFAGAGNAAARTPSSAEISAAACARFAIAAAARGKVLAVPGLSTKLIAMSAHFAPRAWVRRISGRVTLPRLGYPRR